MLKEPKTLREVIQYFADEDKCLEYLRSKRWPKRPDSIPTHGSSAWHRPMRSAESLSLNKCVMPPEAFGTISSKMRLIQKKSRPPVGESEGLFLGRKSD